MPANKTAFQDALKKASNAAWDHRWETAVAEYRRALTEFPDDPTAHGGLALALQELNQSEQALAEYLVLVKMAPEDPVPLGRAALLMEKLNRRTDAVTAYLHLAGIYQHQAQMTKAVEAWRKASSLDPERPEPHIQLAAAFEEAGHNAPAAREWIALGKLAQRGGDTPRAQHCAERALALEPENTAARFLYNDLTGQGVSLAAQPGANPVEMARRSALARLAASVLDDKTAWRRGESGGHSGVEVDTLLSRAIDAQQKGQTQTAIALYEQIIASGFSRPEIQFNLAILYQNTLRHDDAIELLEQTVRTPQFAVASHFAMGQSMRAQGRIDDALDHFIAAMKIVDLSTVGRSQADQVIRLYESLSDSYRAKGDEESARNFSETLLTFLASKGWQDKVRQVRDHIESMSSSGTPLSMQEVFETPESQRVIELLGAVKELQRANKLNAASDLAYYAIELAPNYLPSHVAIAEISVATGQLAQAESKYDMLAETAEIRRDLPKAISFYRQALELGPNDPTRRAKLISVLVQSGQLTQALDEYEGVGKGLEDVGQYQKAADKYAEGLALARRAGVVGETVNQLQRKLGTTYLKLGDSDKALAVFQEMQRTDPDDAHTRYYLIELYLRRGDTLRAEAELDALLDRYGGTPQYAIATLTSLIESFPEHVALTRRLAQYHAAQGDKEQAIQILDALGDRLLNSGNQTEAVGVVQDIIALEPEQVNDYRRLLLELSEA